jgi:predicted TIM-barrel fold metal-dependent hydrolase
VNLVRTGKAYVKVSAPYHLSTQSPDYPDVTPLAKALIAANPQRVLWGSDWPHATNIQPKFTDISPLRQVDDGRLLNQFAVWAPNATVRKTILVDNPARLFGY